MYRSVALVAIAVLALSAVVHASFILPASDHQVKGDATDAIGPFAVSDSQSDPICPRRIAHNRIAVPVPHAAMRMNGKQCTDGGNMTLLEDAGEATSSAPYVVSTINEISNIASVLDTLIFGFEENGRVCGDVEIPAQSLVVIMRSSEDTSIELTQLYQRFRYMLIFYPDGSKCVYFAKLRDPPKPEPTPESPPASPLATPSPDDDSSSVPAGVPAGSPTGSPAGSPDASAPASPVPAPPSGGEEEEEGEEDSPEAEPSPGHGGDDESESTAEPSDEPDDPVCFPADATVQLEDGSVKKMADVSVGDRVLVADGEYSDVFMFSHKIADIKHSFVTLRTESGLSISATSGHYLYINGQLAAARTAKTGDTMTRANGVSEAIVEVTKEAKTGLYNPQTVHGDIIVNEIRASTFTQTVKHCTAQALLAPIRLAYKALGLSLNAFNNGADSIASVMPKGKAIA